MDLLHVPGIGRVYADRLRASGIRDARALAEASDLEALARSAIIPESRLAAAQQEARRIFAEREAGEGIAMELAPNRLLERAVQVAGHALTLREWALHRLRALLPLPKGRAGRAEA